MQKSTKSPSVPQLPNPDAQSIVLAALTDETEYCDVILTDLELKKQCARFVSFSLARLTYVKLCDSELADMRLGDVRLDKCDLSNNVWNKWKASRVELADCKLTGLQAMEGNVSDCLVVQCVGRTVQFQGTKFKNVVFERCDFRGVDFRFCDLQSAAFRDCNLVDAEFYDANLKGCDLRSSTLAGVKANPFDLKGAVIDEQQAAVLGKQLAELMGMKVL